MEGSERNEVSSELRARLEEAGARAAHQLRRTIRDWPAHRPAPIHTVGGRWWRPSDLWTDWTPGFYAGQLWILHKLTQDNFWREHAEEHTRKLASRRFDRDVHDLGFIFLSSYRRWLDAIDLDHPLATHIIDTLVTAATVQSYRWNDNGPARFIYSFNGPQSLFIDVMMNVRLLFWARDYGAPGFVWRRAIEHSRTTLKYLVRRDGRELGAEDGSVAHEAIFNTEPGRGEFRCLSTQQGYSPFTCWSRGLAWAIYGFAEAYRYTGEPDFLSTAERCARFYLERTPEDGVPFWDYGAPSIPSEPLDSSAAAVAGSGLWILASMTRDAELSRRARAMALTIAQTLTSDDFSGAKKEGEEGLLLHSTYHRPRDWGVDESTMWGDYFFLELIERLLAEAR